MQNQGLVNVKDIDSSIIVDLKYSSLDNFFGEDVYGLLSSAYLQKKPAEALARANAALRNGHENYRLLIFDAARPLSVQKILWQKLDTIPQKRRKNFVADPAEGSIHNYGCAVDLSVFDLNQKKELDMGTKYDFFGFLAYPRLEDQMLNEGKLTAAQIENRKILRQAMKFGGFEGITSEWWHFNFHDRQKSKELYKIVE
jgi:zinc D-Ala-D-Ala dipeptidase